jgi:hypothetical protein
LATAWSAFSGPTRVKIALVIGALVVAVSATLLVNPWGDSTVRVGDSKARVEEVLGPWATKNQVARRECWYYRTKDLQVCFEAGRVVRIVHPVHL